MVPVSSRQFTNRWQSRNGTVCFDIMECNWINQENQNRDRNLFAQLEILRSKVPGGKCFHHPFRFADRCHSPHTFTTYHPRKATKNFICATWSSKTIFSHRHMQIFRSIAFPSNS